MNYDERLNFDGSFGENATLWRITGNHFSPPSVLPLKNNDSIFLEPQDLTENFELSCLQLNSVQLFDEPEPSSFKFDNCPVLSEDFELECPSTAVTSKARTVIPPSLNRITNLEFSLAKGVVLSWQAIIRVELVKIPTGFREAVRRPVGFSHSFSFPDLVDLRLPWVRRWWWWAHWIDHLCKTIYFFLTFLPIVYPGNYDSIDDHVTGPTTVFLRGLQL